MRVLLYLLLVALSGGAIGSAMTYAYMKRSISMERTARTVEGLRSFLGLDTSQTGRVAELVQEHLRISAGVPSGDLDARMRLRQQLRGSVRALLNPEQQKKWDAFIQSYGAQSSL